MTKRNHKCDDSCKVHGTKPITKELVERALKKIEKKSKTKKTKITKTKFTKAKLEIDRIDKTIDDLIKVKDIFKCEDTFICLQDCLKKMVNINKDHGY
jgi:hypothetical protein